MCLLAHKASEKMQQLVQNFDTYTNSDRGHQKNTPITVVCIQTHLQLCSQGIWSSWTETEGMANGTGVHFLFARTPKIEVCMCEKGR